MPLKDGDKIPLEAIRRVFIQLYLALAAVSSMTVKRAAQDMIAQIRTHFALLTVHSLPAIVQLKKTRGGRAPPTEWKVLGLEYRLVGNPARYTTEVLKDLIVNRLKNVVLARRGQWGAQQEQAVADAIDRVIQDSASIEPDLQFMETYIQAALGVVESRLETLENKQRVLEAQQTATTTRLDEYGERLARLEHSAGLGGDA